MIRGRTNRQANWLLAALLVAFVLRLVPYIIGYAGLYDAYPWLSFAPFALTLVYGPLIYLYVVRITSDGLPHRWWLHLVAAGVQLAYYLAIFAQPLAFKNHYDAAIHDPWIDPIETLLTFVSLGVYLGAAFRRYRHYERWLDDTTSDVGKHGLAWIRTFLVLFGATVIVNGSFELVSRFVHPLSYFNRFWLYAWYAALVYYLALEGWRNAGETYPQPNVAVPETPLAAPAAPITLRDNAADPAAAAQWYERVSAAAYWRDPELTLGKLAEMMGLSAASISRLVNEGLGQNFNEAINRMRVAAVQDRLRDPAESRDLLELALDSGFSSKASFNRSFKAYAGMTPSQFRRDAAAALTAGSTGAAAFPET